MDAFTAGAGLSASNLKLAIGGVTVLVAFAWAAWVAWRTFKLYGTKRIKSEQLFLAWLSAFFITTMIVVVVVSFN